MKPICDSGLGIKLFADGADLASMLEQEKDPRISGFTTNPTLMHRAGVKDYRGFAHDVLQHITSHPISFEVFADDFDVMRAQAADIAGWGENVYVKIPITNSTGQSSTHLIHQLSHDGVKVNVTAVLSLPQVGTACEALNGGAPSVVSVFAGRIADSGRDPLPIMREAAEICRASGGVELLWASPREVLNVVQAREAGCQIITATDEIIRKIPGLGRGLEELSLDTVRMFKRDAEAAGYTL